MPSLEEMRNEYFNRCKNSSALLNKRRSKEVFRENIDEKIKKVNREAIESI
jgi:hypothetical protein